MATTESKTANEEFFDAMVRHQIYTLRYSGTVRNRILKVLNDSEAEIAKKIISTLEGNVGLVSPSQFQQLFRVQKIVKKVRDEAWKEATKILQSDVTEIATAEPVFMKDAVTSILPVELALTLPSASLLKSIAVSRPFEGRLLKDWASKLQADDITRIHRAIQRGMVTGLGSKAIAQLVIGTGAARGIDGITQLTRNDVDTITRTAVQYVANYARREFFRANSDIIDKEQFVATLDSRTTILCMGHDGKVYEFGKGPQPPLHMNCRSLRVVFFDGVVLGQRPMKGSTEKQLLREFSVQKGITGRIRNRDEIPRGLKGTFDAFARRRVREMIGRMPTDVFYPVFLRRQPEWFQNDVLGVTRAKLFRTGKITLDKFVDRKGALINLTDLMKLHPAAFRAAGL